MSRRRAGITILALALLVLAAAPPAGAAAPAFVAGEVLVKFRPGTAAAERERVLAGLGAFAKGELPLVGAARLGLSGIDVGEAVAKYASDPAVAWIEPNYIWQADVIPDDPRFGELWGLHNTGQSGGVPDADIDAPEAWDESTGSGSVLVAVIDTGLDYTHPDLAANVWTNPGEVAGNGLDDDANGWIDDVHGADFVNGDGDPQDDHGHGTHCAGTIGAVGNNGVGVAGVCWDVRIMGLKFLDWGGYGTTAGAVAAVAYAVDMGARVLSCSWGYSSFSQALADALAAAGEAGVVVVASAGNDSHDLDTYPHFPAAFELDNIIAVAATTAADDLAWFSCWGLHSVDIGAPGEAVLSTLPGGQYDYMDGTSMACPHVSGALALLLARFPGMPGATARTLVLNSARPVPALAGRVVTGAALDLARAMAGPDSIPPAPIADLAVTAVAGDWVELAWTATGDDGTTGAAATYEIRHATAPIDSLNFASATPATGLPVPAPAGSQEAARVTGLAFGARHWFAIRARDDYGLASPVVTTVSAETAPPPVISVAPDSFDVSLPPGAVAERTLVIGNSGQSELTWRIAAESVARKSVVTLPPTPATGPTPEPVAPADAQGGRRPAAVRRDGALTAELADLRGARVVWDIAHGQEPIALYHSHILASLTALGAQVSQNSQPLSDSVLAGADLLWCREMYEPYSPAEIDALVRWLHAGGGLLLEGDQSPDYFNELLSAAQTGLEFGGFTYSGVTTQILPHVTTAGITALALVNPLSGLARVDEPATLLVRDFASLPAIAVSAVGGGRVAAFCDEIMDDYSVPLEQNELFTQQVVAWLTGVSWLQAEPAAGVVPPGGAQDVAVRFDAGTVCGEELSARLAISSNDPATPVARVGARLTAPGVPDIAVPTAFVAWGERYVGAVMVDTLVVANAGCGPLAVTAVAAGDPDVTVSPAGPFPVAAGGAAQVIVRWAPTRSGALADTLVIASDDPDEPFLRVALGGLAQHPPVMVVSPMTIEVTLPRLGTELHTMRIENRGEAALEWSAETDIVPVPDRAAKDARRVLFLLIAGSGDDAYAPALQRLGWEYRTVSTWASFASDLATGGPWDVAIVSSHSTTPTTAQLDQVLAYVEAGGSLLYSDASLAGYAAHPLVARLGIANPVTLVMPQDVLPADPAHECFRRPNLVGALRWDVNRRYIDGHSVTVRDGAFRLASFAQHPGQAAIVIGADGGTIFNGFQVDEFVRDSDGDGVSDAVELVENELVLVDNAPSWLVVEPRRGSVPGGGVQEVALSFRATGTCGARLAARLEIAGNDPILPRAALSLSLEVGDAPDIRTQPPAVDFGTLFVSQAGADTVLVTNTGCRPLTITGLEVAPAPFGLRSAAPFTLGAAETRAVVVTCRPDAPGALAGALTILSDDADEPVTAVPLTAGCVLPPVLALSRDEVTLRAPAGGRDAATVTISNLGTSDLVWSAAKGGDAATGPRILILTDASYITSSVFARALTRLELPYVAVANWGALMARLTEDAPWDLLIVDAIAIPPTASALEQVALHLDAGGALIFGDYALGYGSLNFYPLHRLLVGMGIGFDRVFSGEAGFTALDPGRRLFERPNDVNSWATTAPARIGSAQIVHALPGAQVLASFNAYPGSGAIVRNASGRSLFNAFRSERYTADVANNNGVPDMVELAENEIALLGFGDRWLSAEPASGVIGPGDSQELVLGGDAAAACEGLLDGRVLLATNDPLRPLVDLRVTLAVEGGGDLGALPGLVDFGGVVNHGHASSSVSLYNDGCEPKPIAAITCTGDQFSLARFEPVTLAPGSSLVLPLEFRPTTVGLATGTLVVRGTDPRWPPLVVPLSGVGLPAPRLAAAPDSQVVSLRPGESRTVSLFVANTGESVLRWYANETIAIPDTSMVGAGPRAAVPGQRPRVLVMSSYNPDTNAFVAALQRLDYEYEVRYGWYDAIDALLEEGPWDLVIVENYFYAGLPHPSVLAALAGADAPLIFADSHLSTYQDNPLLNRLGIAFVATFSTPRDLVAGDAEHPCFTRPHKIRALEWSVNPMDLDGQHVMLLTGSLALAAFSEGPATPAIVYNPERRTIFHAFQSANYDRDDDGDGVADAVELAENEIVMLARDTSWLSLTPPSGALMPGQQQEVRLTLDGRGHCGDTSRSTIVLATNDPLAYSLPVPVTMVTTTEPHAIASRTALALGDCFLGVARSDTLRLDNGGCADLAVEAIESSSAAVTVTPQPPFTIPPGEAAVLTVRYEPAEAGPVAATLTVRDNEPDDQPLVIGVTAAGVVPPVIAVAPTDFAVTLPADGAATRHLTIANSGPHPLEWAAVVYPADAARVLAELPPLEATTAPGMVAKEELPASTLPPGPDDTGRAGLREWQLAAAPAPPGLKAAPPTLEEVLARLDAGHEDVTRLIPDRFDFTDGVSGQFINDGGDDMYDAGNAIYTNFGGPANYTDGAISLGSTMFGYGTPYFTRKYPGLFVLAADLQGLEWFRITGGLGADGAGRVDAATLEVTVEDGQRMLGLVKRVHGAGDPSVNHLVIVESRAGVAQQFSPSTDTDYHNVSGLGMQTRLYYLLYASADGGYVDNEATKTIMMHFLATIGLGLGWVSLEPSSGTVAPGASQAVALDFVGATFAPGDHEASIIVASNDPLRPEVAVGAHLRILAHPGALSVAVEATQGGASAGVLRLGVTDGASDGFDPGFDLPAESPPAGVPSAWFSHPDWGGDGGRLRTDQRSAFDLEGGHKTWEFAVVSAGTGPVTLAATCDSPLPLATRLLLLDEQTGAVHDLGREPTYTCAAAAADTLRFAVRVGTSLPPREPAARDLAAGWSLVGLSTWPAPAATVTDLLLAGAPGGSWLYAWNAGNGSYDVVAAESTATCGAGYWFYGAAPFAWTAGGGLALGEVTVPLAAGWTLAGYPLWFAGDLAGASVVHGGVRRPFAEAVSAGLVAPVAFDWTAAGNYGATAALEPWRAYWIASYVEGASLSFRHEAMAAAVAAATAAGPLRPAGDRAGDWSLVLGLDGSVAAVTIGQSARATEGLDPRLDLPAAPRAPGAAAADIRLPRPAWTVARGLEFASDIRPAGSGDLVFDVQVAGEPGRHVLSWDASVLPPGRDLELRAGGRVLVPSLRAQDSLAIVVGQGSLNLQVATTAGADAPPADAGGPRLRNRPNPFNPTTEVLFDLPAAGRAAVCIYDTRGILVRRLDAGRLGAGPVGLTWDGLDDRGQRVGSGVYVYRLEFEGRQLGESRKMVLLK